MTTIDLTWCCFITNDALLASSLCCLNFASFTFRGCHQTSDCGIRAVLQVCHERLLTVQLERWYNITDVLCFFSDELQPFPNLSYLKVIDASISDLGITEIAEKSPYLQTLIVGEHCFNPYNIHGTFVSTVGKKCKKLKRLKSYSARIKESHLTAIGENLPLITDPYLRDCRDCSPSSLLKA